MRDKVFRLLDALDHLLIGSDLDQAEFLLADRRPLADARSYRSVLLLSCRIPDAAPIMTHDAVISAHFVAPFRVGRYLEL